MVTLYDDHYGGGGDDDDKYKHILTGHISVSTKVSTCLQKF